MVLVELAKQLSAAIGQLLLQLGVGQRRSAAAVQPAQHASEDLVAGGERVPVAVVVLVVVGALSRPSRRSAPVSFAGVRELPTAPDPENGFGEDGGPPAPTPDACRGAFAG